MTGPVDGRAGVARRASVLHSRDFRLFWTGETVSLFGTWITYLGLPLVALERLGAGPAQLGFLATARYSPFLLLSIPIGLWVDRRHRRPTLVAANAASAGLVALVPLLAALDLLAMAHLYVVAFLVGTMAVVLEVGYFAFVPAVAGGRENLVDANSKIVGSMSAAQAGGPGVAGLLIGWLGATAAMVVDAVSFLCAAVGIAGTRPVEDLPSERRDWRSELREGAAVAFSGPYLRTCAKVAATYNFCVTAILVCFVPYATQDLGLGATALGVLLACSGVGAVLSAATAPRVGARLGYGRAFTLGVLLSSGTPFLIAGPGSDALGTAALAVVWFVGGFGLALGNVHVTALRQATTPRRLLGRANAIYRLPVYGASPVGAALVGVLADRTGYRTAILVAGLLLTTNLVRILRSPVPGLRSLADLPEEAVAAGTVAERAAAGGAAAGEPVAEEPVAGEPPEAVR